MISGRTFEYSIDPTLISGFTGTFNNAKYSDRQDGELRACASAFSYLKGRIKEINEDAYLFSLKSKVVQDLLYDIIKPSQGYEIQNFLQQWESFKNKVDERIKVIDEQPRSNGYPDNGIDYNSLIELMPWLYPTTNPNMC